MELILIWIVIGILNYGMGLNNLYAIAPGIDRDDQWFLILITAAGPFATPALTYLQIKYGFGLTYRRKND